MKKVISVLLAILMLFSTATVAFAADDAADETAVVDTPVEGEGEATDEETAAPESAEELLAMLEGMSWTEIKFAFKVAKIAVKLVLVLDKLGFVDLSPIKDAILEMAWDLIKDYIDQEQTEDAPAEGETEAPAEVPAA